MIYGHFYNNYSPKWREISTIFTNTEMNNCVSINHTSSPKGKFVCDNIPTKAILFCLWLLRGEQYFANHLRAHAACKLSIWVSHKIYFGRKPWDARFILDASCDPRDLLGRGREDWLVPASILSWLEPKINLASRNAKNKSRMRPKKRAACRLL